MGKKFEKMFKEYAVSQMGRCVKNDTIPDALRSDEYFGDHFL